MMLRARVSAGLTALLFLAGCSGGTGGVADILIVARVDVAPAPGSLTVGQTVQLTATPRTSSGIVVPNRTITWSSSIPASATVSTTGLVTAVAPSATPVVISARADGVTGSVSIQIAEAPVASVTVTPPTASIRTGETVQLQAQAFDATNTPLSRPLLWASTAPAVASVGTTGLVTGLTPGNASITASAGGQSGSASVTVQARTASRLGFLVQPGATPAGAAITPPLQVAVLDDIGGTVPGATHSITVALGANPSGGTLAGQRTVSAVNGVATFPGLRIDRAGTNYSLSASTPGLPAVQSILFDVLAGNAGALRLAVPPQGPFTVNAVWPTPPQIQVVDNLQNPVATAGVNVTAAITAGPAGATLLGTVTVATSATGRASFSDLRILGLAGTYTVTFSAPGLQGTSTDPLFLGPGTPSQMTISQAPSGSASSGIALAVQPAVQIRDVAGNPVSQGGIPVGATLVGPAGATLGGVTAVATNSAGLAVFSNLTITGPAGTYTLQFSSGALTPVSSPPINLGAGTGSRLRLDAAPSPNATNGIPFTAQPVVQLVDVGNNPVASVVPITVTATGPGAILGGTTSLSTTAAGRATFTDLRLTGTVGSYQLTFTSPGVTGVTSGTITLAPGAATQMLLTTAPTASPQSGVPFPTQPVVRLADLTGNLVAQAGVVVAAARTSGTATLSGTLTATTDATGTATWTDLRLTGTAGPHVLTFSAPGLTSVSTGTLTLTAGPATTLVLTTQPPATATNGAAFTSSTVVALRDASNNPVSQAGVPVSATIATGAGGTLGGTLTVNTVANGTATFSNLTLTGTSGDYTLQFAAPGVTAVVSTTITLSAGTGSKLGITTQPPGTATNGVAFSQAPVIQLLDASNNPVPQSGVSVTVSVLTGSGTLTGTLVRQTNGAGAATFPGLVITGTVAESHTLLFAAPGFVAVQSNAINLVAGAAASVSANTPLNPSATVGTAVAPAPSVKVTDVGGIPVSGVNVTFTASAGSTLNPPSGSVIATNATGDAGVTSWTLSTTAGPNTLTASVAGAGFVVFTGTGTAGPAATIAASSSPPPSATAGTSVTPPAVLVTDTNGNPVSGVSVTFAITAGAGSIMPANGLVTTNASGIAALTTWTLDATVGANTVTATASGLAGSPVTFTVTGTAGSPSSLVSNSSTNQSAAAGTAVGDPPSVLVRDSGNNPVSGVDVSFSVTSGGGSISPVSGTVTTDASGIATLTSWTLGTTAGTDNNTVSASIGALGPVVFTASATAGSATTIAASSAPPASAPAGSSVTPPEVIVTDANGNPVAGVSVTFTITVGAGSITPVSPATITTNASGIAALTDWTLDAAAGTNTVTATAAGLAGSPVTFTVTGTVGSPSSLTSNSSTNQSATAGTAVGDPPSVLVRDSGNNPVSGVDVSFSVTAGGGSISPVSGAVTTDASGIATLTSWTLGTTAGTDNNTVSASTGALGPVVFTASATAGAPTSMTANSAVNQSAAVNTAVAAPPSVVARDAGNNPVAGVTVTFSVTAGGGSIVPVNGIVTTDAAGIATLTSWTLGAAAGTNNNSVTAALAGLPDAVFTASGTAGPAAKLALTQPPSANATSGVAFGQQPIVQLQDANGNAVSQMDVVITVTISAGPGGTLGGTVSLMTAADGSVTFTDLVITGPPGVYTLSFDSAGLTSVTADVTIS